MISNQAIKMCKDTLEKRQTYLINQVQNYNAMRMEMAQESSGELSNYDNHPADTGTELFDREKDEALNGHAEKELEDINAALHAIDEGTYGICAICGEDIPLERLEAMPTADKCIKHANDNRDHGIRPVEEQVLSPNLNPDGPSGKDEVGYDAEDAWQEVSRYGTSETPSDFYGDRDNYNEMYPNSDEHVGYPEAVENIVSAHADGSFAGVTTDYKGYEEARKH